MNAQFTQSVTQPSEIHGRVLRIHGAVLFFVASVSVANDLYSHFTGLGIYGFLRDNPMVSVGLLQAYLLMAVIAGVLLSIAAKAPSPKWHIVAALAHMAPLTVILLFWNVLRSQGFLPIAIGSLTFHSLWICIELLFVFRKG